MCNDSSAPQDLRPALILRWSIWLCQCDFIWSVITQFWLLKSTKAENDLWMCYRISSMFVGGEDVAYRVCFEPLTDFITCHNFLQSQPDRMRKLATVMYALRRGIEQARKLHKEFILDRNSNQDYTATVPYNLRDKTRSASSVPMFRYCMWLQSLSKVLHVLCIRTFSNKDLSSLRDIIDAYLPARPVYMCL